jgi:hypothetical protein
MADHPWRTPFVVAGSPGHAIGGLVGESTDTGDSAKRGCHVWLAEDLQVVNDPCRGNRAVVVSEEDQVAPRPAATYVASSGCSDPVVVDDIGAQLEVIADLHGCPVTLLDDEDLRARCVVNRLGNGAKRLFE